MVLITEVNPFVGLGVTFLDVAMNDPYAAKLAMQNSLSRYQYYTNLYLETGCNYQPFLDYANDAMNSAIKMGYQKPPINPVLKRGN